ncbi:MAG: hypothetical protein Q9179_004789 [Wetmoreana sp. 5 TL-2023]
MEVPSGTCLVRFSYLHLETSKRARIRPLEVKAAPYTAPANDEIVVKSAAVAVLLAGWATQALTTFPHEYSSILGRDIAGGVFEVGKSVTAVKKGDRVLGYAIGQSQVFVDNKSSVVSNIAAALEGKTVAGGFDAIGAYEAFDACLEVVTHPRFSGVNFISTVRLLPEKLTSGVSAKLVLVGEIKDGEVSKAIFHSYLPRALAEGTFIAASDPYVVGKGLEYVQAGINMVGTVKKVDITL